MPKLDHLSAPLFLCSVPTSPKPEQMALLILGCHVLSPGPRGGCPSLLTITAAITVISTGAITKGAPDFLELRV